MSTDEVPAPILQRETILPSSDRGRLAAIVATCSLAGLAGGMALSMLAETHRAVEAARAEAYDRDAPTAWLGIHMTPPHPEHCTGARVMSIDPRGPSEHIGLHRGDVIVGFGGDRICDNQQLIDAVQASSIGSTPEVVVKRGARDMVFHPRLATMPDDIRRSVFGE
jgi:S1-C subfamily serine protease